MAESGTGPTPRPEARDTAPTDLRARLSAALAGTDPYRARLAADAETDVEAVPAPFLRRHGIYRVTHFSETGPVMFYAGFAPGAPALVLTARPESFVRMAREDGVAIGAPAEAAAYAAVFLEVTRDLGELFYLVRSVREVGFRPGLDGGEAEARDRFLREMESAVTPPEAVAAENGFRVTAYAVREQAVERHTLDVRPDGEIRDSSAVVAAGLPLVYGL
jgi:hypothetical protein